MTQTRAFLLRLGLRPLKPGLLPLLIGADFGTLSFFAGLRGTPLGFQTVEVFDVDFMTATSTSLTGWLDITMASTASEWNFNTFGVDFTNANVGDTIQVVFRATGDSAQGLELTGVNFTAVPEPSSIAMLTLLGLAGAGGYYRRRKQSGTAAVAPQVDAT